MSLADHLWRAVAISDRYPPGTCWAWVESTGRACGDPFGGTGTVALVADVLGRHGISVDMSADYCRLAQWRTSDPRQRAKAARIAPAPQPPDDQPKLDLTEAS